MLTNATSSPAVVEDYAKRARSLMWLAAELRALGAEADIDLPKVTVIGNQSAGKSSLVEAVADIKVPRDSGTCTRCPMECRLSYSSDDWRCQVLLRIEKDEFGQRLPKTSEEPFGPVITDKEELESRLRCAQLAILNPSLPATSFVDFNLSQAGPGTAPAGTERQLQFSSNVVVLDIRGPEVPDLSFIDLPGIIANVAEGEDPGNVDLVKSLVKDHIGGNALILVVITMRDDMDNQSAVSLAKEADPDGTRTIGVLTKPDTVQHGEEQGWLDVLQGRRYRLRHGYFVTKQPGPKELKEKIDRTTARRNEQIFFHQTTMWSTADARLKQRLGVDNLAKDLSRLLSQLIEQTLPKLRKDSKESLAVVRHSLDELPPPPSTNPTIEILNFITTFANAFHSIVEAADGHEDVMQRCRQVYTLFQEAIERTTPKFSAAESTIVDNEPSESAFLMPRTLGGVHRMIQRSLTRQLPFNVPSSVKSRMMKQCFEDWPDHATDCFNAIHSIVQNMLEPLVKEYFGRYSALQDQVSTIIEVLVEDIKTAVEANLMWILTLNDPPFTLNDHYFKSYREKYMNEYRKERQHPQAPPIDSLDAPLNLNPARYCERIPTPPPQIPDKYEEEIVVMAEVRAYFQVAYKRIIDEIPLIIDHDFIRKLDKKMHTTLIADLKIGEEGSSSLHAEYLREDPSVVGQRDELTNKRERLREIIKKLSNFSAPS